METQVGFYGVCGKKELSIAVKDHEKTIEGLWRNSRKWGITWVFDSINLEKCCTVYEKTLNCLTLIIFQTFDDSFLFFENSYKEFERIY